MNCPEELLKLTEKDFPGVEMWIVGAMRKVCLDLIEIRQLVAKQAEDEGLWCEARFASEAYMQQGLRTLHEIIEGKTSFECAMETLKDI